MSSLTVKLDASQLERLANRLAAIVSVPDLRTVEAVTSWFGATPRQSDIKTRR